jgi:outer membrane protein
LFLRNKEFLEIIVFVLFSSIIINGSEDVPKPRHISLGSGIHLALKSSKEVELAETKLKIAQSKEGEAIGNYLPSITASWQVGKQKNKVEGVAEEDPTNQNTQKLSVEQTVFNGFQSAYKSQSSKYAVLAAKSDLNQTKANIAFSAVEVYLNLYTERRKLLLQKENVKISKEILKKVSERMLLKVISKNEAAQYEANTLRSHSDLLDARKATYKAEAMYVALIGEQQDHLSEPKWPTALFNIQEEHKKAGAKNQGLQKLYFLQKSARADLAGTKGALLPKAKLVGSYKKQKEVLYLGNKDVDTTLYYVDVSLPIFEKGQRFVQIGKANNQFELTKKEYEFAKESILKDLKSTIQTYHANRELVGAYWELQKMASRKLRRLKYQLRLGATDKLAVLTTKQEVNSINARVLTLRKELFLDYYKVLLLNGSSDWYKKKNEQGKG